jgi:hypothetical protein
MGCHPSAALALPRHRSTPLLRLALRLFHETPWSPRLVGGDREPWVGLCVLRVRRCDVGTRYAAARPHVPEASATVDQGRVLLEGGSTFTTTHVQGLTRHSHMYPEALCGMA